MGRTGKKHGDFTVEIFETVVDKILAAKDVA